MYNKNIQRRELMKAVLILLMLLIIGCEFHPVTDEEVDHMMEKATECVVGAPCYDASQAEYHINNLLD